MRELAKQLFELGNVGGAGVGVAVVRKGPVTPFSNRVAMEVMPPGNMGERRARFDLAQPLDLELVGELTRSIVMAVHRDQT